MWGFFSLQYFNYINTSWDQQHWQGVPIRGAENNKWPGEVLFFPAGAETNLFNQESQDSLGEREGEFTLKQISSPLYFFVTRSLRLLSSTKWQLVVRGHWKGGFHHNQQQAMVSGIQSHTDNRIHFSYSWPSVGKYLMSLQTAPESPAGDWREKINHAVKDSTWKLWKLNFHWKHSEKIHQDQHAKHKHISC